MKMKRYRSMKMPLLVGALTMRYGEGTGSRWTTRYESDESVLFVLFAGKYFGGCYSVHQSTTHFPILHMSQQNRRCADHSTDRQCETRWPEMSDICAELPFCK